MFHGRGARRVVVLTISSTQTNYNAFTAAGSPSGACSVYCTVNSGITVKSNSISTPAFDTGAWGANSTFYLKNNGNIYGTSGGGGNGPAIGSSGNNGDAGGTALNIRLNITADNTSGNVWGGGGGGGSGGASSTIGGGGKGGGGAGGGSGVAPQSGGVGGLNGDTSKTSTDGSSSGGGAGGSKTDLSGAGGAGGAWGVAGTAGDASDPSPIWSGGSGGAAGNAVKLNGKTITWLAGNNGTQVKGPQS